MAEPERPATVDEAIARVVREEIARLSLRRQRVLTLEQTAEYLGTSEGTVHNLVALGKLKPCRFDRRPRFDIDDVNRLVEESKDGR
jgi:excisionase family DNA binding protein